MKDDSSDFPGKVTYVETENRRVRTSVLNQTEPRVFYRKLLLTF